MKVISIILTTFNSEDTIEMCLRSIKNQVNIDKSYKIQLLIVDCGSIDNTENIIKKLGYDYYKIKDTGGPNHARNYALKKVKGDYICFIDPDDKWHPDKLKLQLEIIKYAAIISTGYKPGGNKIIISQKNEVFKRILKRDYKHDIFYSSLMIDARLKNVFFEEEFGLVDFDWLLRLYEDQKTAHIERQLLIRYVGTDNLSLRKDCRMKNYYYSLYILEKYRDYYPKEVKKGIKKLTGSIGRYYYLINDMKRARRCFIKTITIKNIGYYLTSFIGSSFIKTKFNIFG